MKTIMSANKTPRVLGALLAAGLGVTAGLRLAHRPANVRHADNAARMTAAYDSLPLSFEPNRGQAPDEVRFSARGDGYGLYLTSNQAVLAMQTPQGGKSKAALLRMNLLGARQNARSAGVHQLPGVSNYFLGKDPKKWRTHVPTYAQVKYDAVYPGVDLLYYGNQRRLEYDFLVQPGADASAIRLGFDGADRVSVDRTGDLVLELGGRSVRQHRPVVYQEINGTRKSVPGSYQLLAKNEVGFSLGNYDQTRPLVIDPVLSYSGYLGTADRDLARNIVVDPDGNAYITGVTFGADFAGVARNLSGPSDAFVTKVALTGQSVVYSTYLGGTGSENIFKAPDTDAETLAGAVAIDNQRQAYLTGYTDSVDFPLVSPIQVVNGGNGDAFVVKLNEAGGIVYSTYLGGRDLDTGNGIAVAQAADGPNAYIVGQTYSHDFNLANPYQQFKGKDTTGTGSDSDAFVTRLNAAGSGLVYSTYLGGGADERGEAIAVGPNGSVYATGVTLSGDFPTTPNAYSENGVGSSDIFVTKLRDLGAQDDPQQLIEYSSYFGGTGENLSTGIAVDRLGRAYVTGYTTSTDLPTGSPAVIPGVYDGSKYGGRSGSAGNQSDGGASDGFLAKFDPQQFGTASLVQATYLGGNGQDVASGVTVSPVSSDPSSGDYVAYVTGWTTSSNYPTVAALRTSPVGGQDIFVSKVTAPGTSFEYSTYLGGTFNDVSSGIAVDSTGRAYVTGSTQSTNYPVLVTNTGPVGGISDVVISRLASPPGAPTGLAGTAVSPTQIDLTWVDNSDNEGDGSGVGFQVERSTGGGAFQVVGSTAPNVNTFSDGLNATFPLQPETAYIYRVRAVSSVGASAYSNAIPVTTLPVPPADPSALNATPLSQTSVRLDWSDNSSNETAFEIERAPESSPGSGQPGTFALAGTVSTGITTYVDSGLAVFTTYFYQVRATNAGGASGYAGPVQTKTLDNVPAAPTSLNAVAVSDSSIQLSWTDNASNELGFEVQRSSDGFNFTSITTSLLQNTTTYTDTGLAGNTVYTYKVRAFNSGGNSAFTNEASATTFPNPPSAATGLTVTVPAAPNGITKLALSWTDTSNNESGFKIERSTDDFADPLNTTLVATVGTNVVNYTDSGLAAATKYYYRVRATNQGGDSANSNVANGTTLPNPPAAPSGLTATALSQTSVRLDWVDNSTNETGFKIERSLNGAVFDVTIPADANEITYTDTGLTPNATYYYRVRATNTGGDSAPSSTVSVTTLPNPPGAPTGLTGSLQVVADPYSLQVNLNWVDGSNNETGFKIERSADGTTYGQITIVGTGVQAYADTTVSPDATYSYRVTATNAGGDSAPSNVVTVSTPPAAPTNARPSGITKNSIQIFWNDNSQTETNFLIRKSTDGVNFSDLTQVAKDTTSYTDTGLAGDTTYSYRVYAVNTAGKSDGSNVTEGKTLPAAPADPSDLTATAVSQTEIQLAWHDNSGNESGFKIERSTDAFGTPANVVQIAVVGAGVTSYSDTGLNIGTHYWYRVRAYNTGDDSGYSNTADAATFPTAPTGPTGLTISVQSSSTLVLSWKDNSSNEDTFQVERSTNGSFSSSQVIASVPGSIAATGTYTDSTGLNPNATYYYRVAAVNLGGTSGYSNPASALTLPSAPANLNATSQPNGSIRVTWAASVGGADSYIVEYKNVVSSDFTEYGRVAGNVTSIVDASPNPNSTFIYRVKALNRSGSSAYSNEDSATTAVGLASITTNVSTIKAGKKLTITVTLTGPAPAGGATVSVVSQGDGGANVKAPASILVPAGAQSASVKVKIKKPKRAVVATLTASYGGSSQSTDVTVKK
jgi:titin